jgi:oligoendopeptidase F
MTEFHSSSSATAAPSVEEFIEQFNRQYEMKHKAYEDNFWATKMNLKGCSGSDLVRSKSELDSFLGNKVTLEEVRRYLSEQDLSLTNEQNKILKCYEKTLSCYIIEDPLALQLKENILTLESELAESRNHMSLGYVRPSDGQFIKASSVQLRNMLRTNDDPAIRLACLEGLRSIGTFLAEKFCEIIKLRNRLARLLGFECFYDMKVTQAEGFNKQTLFAILDQLEVDTRPIMEQALQKLSQEKGAEALEPENTSYLLSGDVAKLKDPYFPFEDAVDVWARSFAALGISYQGAVMRLDLCDREGKYSNGFCHWPQPAWVTSTGEWIPSQTNFTSLASPKSVGSGHTALVTLMHEGGHAAHFANVRQRSPLFSQERAPTSVAYAENQSMFLDSLVSDADWMGRYAYSREGQVIPWDILEQEIRSTHPYEVRLTFIDSYPF